MRQKFEASQTLSFLRSILIFKPLNYLVLAAATSLATLLSFFAGQERRMHGLIRLWAGFALKLVGAPLTVQGLERIDASRPAVYVANHCSSFDTPVLYWGLPFLFRIVAREGLFHHPFTGWYLRRSGQLAADWRDPASAMRAMYRAVVTLREGIPLVVFPEGGRSSSGRIGKFHRGAFLAALKAGVDVVPLAIVGTYELQPKGSAHIRPRPLELRVGQPVSTSGLRSLDARELASQLEQAVRELIARDSAVGHERAASPELVNEV